VIHRAKRHEAPAVAVDDSYRQAPQRTAASTCNTIVQEYNVEENNRNNHHGRFN